MLRRRRHTEFAVSRSSAEVPVSPPAISRRVQCAGWTENGFWESLCICDDPFRKSTLAGLIPIMVSELKRTTESQTHSGNGEPRRLT